MKRRWEVAAWILLPALAGCLPTFERKRPKEPIAVTQAAIVASVAFKGRELPNLLTHWADEIYYARVTESGDLDLDHPLASNYAEDHYVYLLDVPPGRYAPFAAAFPLLRLRFLARLDDETRKAMTIEARGGEIVFAGNAFERTDWEGLGAMTLNFLKHALGCLPPFKRPTVDIFPGSPKVDREIAAEAQMLASAHAALSGTMWAEAVDRRTRELGAPPPPLWEGAILKHQAPRIQQERFSFVDTLKWGPWRKVPGGLEWREPKGRGQVLVLFLSPGAPDYKPMERVLEELSQTGSPEDSHSLSDVSVSSRTARMARYTTYVYPKDSLPGGSARVLRTEAMVVAAKDGYYFLRLRARREDFEALLPQFEKFLEYLRLEKAQETKT